MEYLEAGGREQGRGRGRRWALYGHRHQQGCGRDAGENGSRVLPSRSHPHVVLNEEPTSQHVTRRICWNSFLFLVLFLFFLFFFSRSPQHRTAQPTDGFRASAPLQKVKVLLFRSDLRPEKPSMRVKAC